MDRTSSIDSAFSDEHALPLLDIPKALSPADHRYRVQGLMQRTKRAQVSLEALEPRQLLSATSAVELSPSPEIQWQQDKTEVHELITQTTSLTASLESLSQREHDIPQEIEEIQQRITSLEQRLSVLNQEKGALSAESQDASTFRIVASANSPYVSVQYTNIEQGFRVGLRHYKANSWHNTAPLDPEKPYKLLHMPGFSKGFYGTRKWEIGILDSNGNLVSDTSFLQTWKHAMMQKIQSKRHEFSQNESRSIEEIEEEEHVLLQQKNENEIQRNALQEEQKNIPAQKENIDSQLAEKSEELTRASQALLVSERSFVESQLRAKESIEGAVAYPRMWATVEGGSITVDYEASGSINFTVLAHGTDNAYTFERTLLDQEHHFPISVLDGNFSFSLPEEDSRYSGNLEVLMQRPDGTPLDRVQIFFRHHEFTVSPRQSDDRGSLDLGRVVENPIEPHLSLVHMQGPHMVSRISVPSSSAYIEIEGGGLFSSATVHSETGEGIEDRFVPLLFNTDSRPGTYHVRVFAGDNSNGLLYEQLSFYWSGNINDTKGTMTMDEPERYQQKEQWDMEDGSMKQAQEMMEDIEYWPRSIFLADPNLRLSQQDTLFRNSSYYFPMQKLNEYLQHSRPDLFGDDDNALIDAEWKNQKTFSRAQVEHGFRLRQSRVVDEHTAAYNWYTEQMGRLMEQAAECISRIYMGESQQDILLEFQESVAWVRDRLPAPIVHHNLVSLSAEHMLKEACDFMQDGFAKRIVELQQRKKQKHNRDARLSVTDIPTDHAPTQAGFQSPYTVVEKEEEPRVMHDEYVIEEEIEEDGEKKEYVFGEELMALFDKYPELLVSLQESTLNEELFKQRQDMFGVVDKEPEGRNYIVSRQISITAQSHAFIVINARYIGDPDATIISYGKRADGNMGRVDIQESADWSDETAKDDRKAWLELRYERKITVGISEIPANALQIEKYSSSIIEDQKYKLRGINSNSAAQHVANCSSEKEIDVEGSQNLPSSQFWNKVHSEAECFISPLNGVQWKNQ